MSLDDVARVMSVARSTVSRWETGKRVPSPDELLAWGDVVGVDVNFEPRARAPDGSAEDLVAAIRAAGASLDERAVRMLLAQVTLLTEDVKKVS